MAYIPKNKIIINLYTDGSEFVYANNTDKSYTGYYHKLYTGRYFTGKNQYDSPIKEIILSTPTFTTSSYTDNTLDTSQNQILNIFSTPFASSFNTYSFTTSSYAYAQINDEISNFVPRTLPTKIVVFPTKDDYANGLFIRYFARKNNDSLYIETNKESFDLYTTKPQETATDLYTIYSINWTLVGDLEEVFKQNQNAVQFVQSSQLIKGLDAYLKYNYLQFYSYNPQNNLYTNGNELITIDGKDYVGPYHVETRKGPTAGPFPLSGQPRLLYKKYSPQFQEKKTTQNLGIG
jgi:hypothetical protein